MLRVKREQHHRIEDLKGQLYAVNRLIQMAIWQRDVRAVLKLSTAVVGAVEGSVASTVRRFSGRLDKYCKGLKSGGVPLLYVARTIEGTETSGLMKIVIDAMQTGDRP